MLFLAQLIFDAGLLILIWLVQLVVYPSFQYYAEKDLLIWHKIYTTQITYVVLPLMVGQLGIYLLQFTQEFSWINSLNFTMIILIWGITFLKAVPLHNQIDMQKETLQAVKQLIQINWWRTILWTIIFGLSLSKISLFLK